MWQQVERRFLFGDWLLMSAAMRTCYTVKPGYVIRQTKTIPCGGPSEKLLGVLGGFF